MSMSEDYIYECNKKERPENKQKELKQFSKDLKLSLIIFICMSFTIFLLSLL